VSNEVKRLRPANSRLQSLLRTDRRKGTTQEKQEDVETVIQRSIPYKLLRNYIIISYKGSIFLAPIVPFLSAVGRSTDRRNGPRAHPASYPMGTRDSFSGGKAAGT
jgi:hypothetical protein